MAQRKLLLFPPPIEHVDSSSLNGENSGLLYTFGQVMLYAHMSVFKGQ